MNANLNGKVAVITGAGGTICSEVAIDLAKNGVKLALVGRTAEKLEKTAAAIKEVGGECFIFACDVCDMEKVMTEFFSKSLTVTGEKILIK